MSIFPVVKFELQSSEKPSDLAARLSKYVQVPSIILYWRPHKTFAGTVTETSFQLIRIGSSRNSFRPTVFGEFIITDQSTIIRVTIKHHISLFIAIVFFSLFFLNMSLWVIGLSIFPTLIRSGTYDMQQLVAPPLIVFLLFPIIVPILLFATTWLSFPSEAKAYKNELVNILSIFNSGTK